MLGMRIAALRRSAGMSQSQLASRLKISPSAVGMYEQGRREPSAGTLVELAKTFGVSTDYLLTGAPHTGADETAFSHALKDSVLAAEGQAAGRKEPLSRQELAVLLAALLLEP